MKEPGTTTTENAAAKRSSRSDALAQRGNSGAKRADSMYGEEVPPGVVNEKNYAAVAIVLTDVLAQRVQRLGDVAGRGE
jgi:hypothetical protein